MWNNEEIAKRQNKVVEWLRQKNAQAQTKGLVCGISGGVDSAVVAGLCKKAFPQASLGVIMPCHSNSADREDAFLTAKTLGIEVLEVNLGDAHTLIYEKVEKVLGRNRSPRITSNESRESKSSSSYGYTLYNSKSSQLFGGRY